LDTLSKWQALTNAQTQNESTQQSILNQKQELENLKLTNKTGQQSLEQKMHAQTQQDLFSIRNLPNDQIVDGALKKLDERLANGLVDQQTYTVQKQGIMNYANDPNGLRARIDTGIVNAMTASEAVKNYGTEVKEVNTGQGQQGYTQSGALTPTPGALKPSGGLIGTGAPSNATLAEPTPIIDERRFLDDGVTENPNFGQPRNVVKGQIVPPGLQRPGPPGPLPPIPGVTPPAPATQPAPATPPAPGTTAPAGTGATPPAPGAGVQVPNTGSPGVATGLPPGVATSLADARKQSTEEGQTLVATDGPRPQTEALLSEILTAANNPKAFTGKDAPAYVSLMQRLQQIPGVVDKSVLEGVGAQESMAKAMANLQTILMSGMIHTNEGLAHVIDQTPHMELTKIGLPGIVHQLQGTLAAQEAMSFAWQQSGLLPYEYQKWRQQFIAPSKDGQFDPRVFWWDKMNKDERGIFLRDVPDKARFDKNFQYAQKKGWVQ
jgi:hypothetical protein